MANVMTVSPTGRRKVAFTVVNDVNGELLFCGMGRDIDVCLDSVRVRFGDDFVMSNPAATAPIAPTKKTKKVK